LPILKAKKEISNSLKLQIYHIKEKNRKCGLRRPIFPHGCTWLELNLFENSQKKKKKKR
jgi:hypothetical protein